MRATTVGHAALVLALLGPGAATHVTAQSLPDLQRRSLAVDPAVAGAEALAWAQRVVTAEQLALARRSFTVGTVPVTDVREAEARADAVAAQVQAAEFDLDLRQQVLAELAAGPAPGLLARGLDAARMPRLEASSAAEWLATAYAQNWQLRQSEQALRVAEAEVRKARKVTRPPPTSPTSRA